MNTVAPGSVRTDASALVNTAEIIDYLAERSLLGRPLEPEDIGEVIAMTADAQFGPVTEQIITVDSGMRVLDQQISMVGKRFGDD